MLDLSSEQELIRDQVRRLAEREIAPLAGVEVRQGSKNDPTECCVTGPHLFLGYVDADDDTHAFERDDEGRDWFCTGDVADLDCGRVRVVGRIRDIVIRKGLKVPISEVEGYVNRLPGIARSAGYAKASTFALRATADKTAGKPGSRLPAPGSRFPVPGSLLHFLIIAASRGSVATGS